MTSDRPAIERLREYLQDLSPAARAMLIAELEGAGRRGEKDAGTEVVLEKLRGFIRGESRPAPRIGNAARCFFMPVEPFLIDGPADHKRLGGLGGVSLDPIWQ